MGEVLPNAIQIMAKSAKDAGLTLDGSVKSMMALQQTGGLISAKVLPFFAKNMSEAARANGGLENAMNSNRVAMNRFMLSAKEAANTIFTAGLSSGLTEFFNTSAKSIVEMKGLWKGLGEIFGAVFRVLSKVIEAVTPTLIAVGNTVDGLATDFGDLGAAILLAVGPTTLLGRAIVRMGSTKKILPFLGAATAIAAAFEKAAFWAEELINAFVTKDKVGILFDPRKEAGEKLNISTSNPMLQESARGLVDSTPFGKMVLGIQDLLGRAPSLEDKFTRTAQTTMQMVSPTNNIIVNPPVDNRPVQVNVQGQVIMEGEVVGNMIAESEAVEGKINQVLRPYLSN